MFGACLLPPLFYCCYETSKKVKGAGMCQSIVHVRCDTPCMQRKTLSLFWSIPCFCSTYVFAGEKRHMTRICTTYYVRLLLLLFNVYTFSVCVYASSEKRNEVRFLLKRRREKKMMSICNYKYAIKMYNKRKPTAFLFLLFWSNSRTRQWDIWHQPWSFRGEAGQLFFLLCCWSCCLYTFIMLCAHTHDKVILYA